MSKYFEKYEYINSYSMDILFIRGYLERHGFVRCTNEKLGKLWNKFSIECYDRGWTIPNDSRLKEFENWLENYEQEDL